MSVDISKRAIARFLRSDPAEILCLRGKWGTGKTYAWNETLLAERGNVSRKSYSYVSLFGLNSINEVRNAIFQNLVSVEHFDVAPSLETLKTNTSAVTKSLGFHAISVAKLLPSVSSYAAAFEAVSFMAVRDKLICIDDLERKGESLQIRDVFGLLSYLKEHRGCKVALILNDDELGERADYDKYFEKVVDDAVEFSPTSQECIAIAFQGVDEVSKYLAQFCTTLNISNIRVLKRIEKLVRTATPTIKSFGAKVHYQTFHTICLLGFCRYSTGEDVPPIEFVCGQRMGLYGVRKSQKDLSEQEKIWEGLLDRYQFISMDEFDRILLEGIDRGYFDESELMTAAAALDKAANANDREGTFRAAWRLFHDKFDNNEAEVVAALKASSISSVKEITPLNLNGTIKLLRDLGHDQEVNEIVDYYVRSRNDERELFDLQSYHFRDDITDPYLIEAFKRQFASYPDNRSPLDLLIQIAKSHSWSPKDVAILNKITADDFYRLIKEADDNNAVILGAYKMLSDVKELQPFAQTAEDALKRLASESQINRLRLKRYGFEFDN